MIVTFEQAPVGADGQPGNPITIGGSALLSIQAKVTKGESGYSLNVKNASGARVCIIVSGYF